MDREQRTVKLKVSNALWAICLIFAGLIPQPGYANDTATPLDLEQYRGQIVWLDFWASWCTPCRRSFPWLNQVLAKYNDDGFIVIGINLDKDPVLVREFLAETPAEFPIVYDPAGTLATRFSIVGMPSAVLIGRDGTIIDTHVGFKRESVAEYETSIRHALAQ